MRFSFEKVSNFREIGGLRTVSGQTVRTGAVYRSGELSRMTSRDLTQLQQLGIKLICDLRSPKESRKKQPRWTPDNRIPVVNIPLHEPATHDLSHRAVLGFLLARNGAERFNEFGRAYYRHIAFDQTSRVREVLTLLSQPGHLPAVIHCTAGRDRTGYIAALLQLLAGVPYDSVRKDYLRTNDYFAPRLEKMIRVTRILTLFQVSRERLRLIVTARPDFLDEVQEAIIAKYGSVEEYLAAACQMSPDTLQTLKRALLTS